MIKYLKEVLTNPIHFIAFGFGSGLAPKGPGTFGTVVGVLIYFLLHKLSLIPYLLITLILTIFSIWICDLSSKMLKVHDYKGIVLDEIVGFLWIMVLVPFTWWNVLLGFILFRLFDIWKPWPISWMDKNIQGGLGIVVDDLVAALYGWCVLQIILFIFH